MSASIALVGKRTLASFEPCEKGLFNSLAMLVEEKLKTFQEQEVGRLLSQKHANLYKSLSILQDMPIDPLCEAFSRELNLDPDPINTKLSRFIPDLSRCPYHTRVIMMVKKGMRVEADFYGVEDILKIESTQSYAKVTLYTSSDEASGEKKQVFQFFDSGVIVSIFKYCNEVMQRLPGNAYEIIDVKSPDYDALRYPKEWNLLPIGLCKDRKTTVSEWYRKYLDPCILATVKTLEGRDFSVVEFGAGTGDLARLILDEMGARIATYRMLDSSKAMKAVADVILMDEKKAQYTLADITSEDWNLEAGEKVDVMLASGFFNYEVITKKDAVRVFKKVVPFLRSGGLFILTGFSKALIHASDFKEAGFIIENRSISFNTSEMGCFYGPFYTAVKA